MNKIFKVVKSQKGNVVASELAKGAGKGSKLTVAALTVLFGAVLSQSALATPVSIQGTATSENAVSIGTDSFATSVDGVAGGKGAVATGQGFTREEFAAKKQEAQTAIDAVNNKQDELNNKGNQLDAAKKTVDGLNKQIDELSKQQDAIADKLRQRDSLLPDQTNAQGKVDADNTALNDAKTSLDRISTNGENLYLDFTKVLRSLDWSPLNGTDEGRNTIARELKAKVEANFSEFASKYDEPKYREIVDGYLNRQASYQGSYEYLNNTFNSNGKYLFGSLANNNILFNRSFFNSGLNESGYLDNYLLENKSGKIFDYAAADSFFTFNEFGDFILKDGTLYGGTGLAYGATDPKYHRAYKEGSEDNFTQKTLNTFILMDESLKKAKQDESLNLLDPYKNSRIFPDKHQFSAIRHNLEVNLADDFVKNYNFNLYKNYADTNRIIFGLKGVSSEKDKVSMLNYDGNIGVLTKLKDFTVSNQNLITSDNINKFKGWMNTLKTYDSSIDWGFDKSAINLTDYKQNLNKVIAYNEKIDVILNLYQSIINERKKSDADVAKIELETKQLMDLKNEVINGATDMSNFIAGITPTYNKQWADYYLNYGKTEADKVVSRINNELKLYNDKDELITEATAKAKEIQKTYDDAKAKLEQDKAELDKVNKQIDELALTDTEKATDDVKRAKEAEKTQAEAEKARLEDEIKKGEDELAGLKAKLNESSLRDLGLRSQAHGSNAFASGDDSIAMGTNATVTKADGIAIGQNTNVTGVQSIAIGKDSTVSGEKSIAIGVGHNVSGNHSTTIGDPNVVSGNESFVAGNNNNVASNSVMVMGNNVTVAQGFDGAVVLGADSAAAKANPTSRYEIKGQEYTFAGVNPTSTVSVGAEGKERQITNVAAGRISDTSTDAINGSQLYALADAIAKKAVTPNDVSDEVANQLETKLVAGDNIQIDKDEATKTFTISATDTNTQSVVVAGNGVTVDSADNAQGTKDYTVSVSDTLVKAGDNVEVTGNAKDGFTVSAKPSKTIINAGKNVTVEGDADTGYTISAKGEITEEQLQNVVKQVGNVVDTNTQSVTKAGQGVTVTESDNDKGTKDYTVSVKATDGLTFSDNGDLKVSDTLVKGGKNVEVTGNAKDGFTVNAKGTVINAGDNVTVKGDADNGYTISATDTNTQSTVSAKGNKGINITVTDNADGTKNYEVETKLGKGLKYDENGAIAATAQAVKGGNGVTVTVNPEEEQVIDVVGVTTTTDDGKSYTRKDLTQAVGVKGDNKNIKTSTLPNGDVKVALADDVNVNTVTANKVKTGNVSMSANGVNAGGKKVTNVAAGDISETSTDAVNGSQLNQVANVLGDRINQNAQNINNVRQDLNRVENKVNQVDHRARKGIAVAGAMGMLPQPHISGKSMVSAATTNYRGEQALAVGYSRLSDNGKVIIKLSGAMNTSGKKDAMVGASVGYQW
jgi:hypothetical protein